MLAIQNAELGGDFEHSAHLRNLRTRTMWVCRPCSTATAGSSAGRVCSRAIFSFVEEPGMVRSPARARQLYGRVLPIHIESAGKRSDALVD